MSITKSYQDGYTEGWDACKKAYRQPGPVWVRASTKLPTPGKVTWRWLDRAEAYSGYDEKRGFVYGTGGASVDPTYYSEIEWLDESGAAPSGEREVADRHGFRESIEDILLSAGKHNQEQCSEIADVILRDLLIVSCYQRKDESGSAATREPDIDELWDEHSEMIDDDIDSLSRWAGSTVVDKEQFRTLVAQLYELFKQQKEK